MTKQEKIKEAWGEREPKLEKNGWLYFGYACNGWNDVEDWLKTNNLNSDKNYYDMTYIECDNGDLVNVKIRPKSLQGIENNNGWIKIESENDLPEKEFYKGYETFPINFRCNSYGLHKYYKSKEITHYQPIEKPKPPIY